MQININEIQRPTMITPFIGQELTPDNEIVEYIDTTTIDKSVTSQLNTSKKALKDLEIENYKYCLSLDIYGKSTFLICFGFTDNLEVIYDETFNDYHQALTFFNKLKTKFFNPLPHKDASSSV